MRVSGEVEEIMNIVLAQAKGARFEYVTPELLLRVICQNKVFEEAFANCGGSVGELYKNLNSYLEEYMETGAADSESIPEFSQSMGAVLSYAWEFAQGGGKRMVELSHIIYAMYELEESYARYYMQIQGVERAGLLQEMAMLVQV